MGRRCGDKIEQSLAANRTRENRLSGMRGGLAESWAMVELGTRRTTERVRVGNSPPTVRRTVFLPDGKIVFSFLPKLFCDVYKKLNQNHKDCIKWLALKFLLLSPGDQPMPF